MLVMPIAGCENFVPLRLNPELLEWTRIFPYKTIRERIGKEGSIYFVIYAGDHNPPHLHAKYQGDEIVINIPTSEAEPFEVARGSLKHRETSAALAWCESNRSYIAENWDTLCNGVYARD